MEGEKAPTDVTHLILAKHRKKNTHRKKRRSTNYDHARAMPLLTDTHPDFDKLSAMNTVFGGYFGSRLMTNIREDKGCTYGIYSSITSYQHGGILEVKCRSGQRSQ
jgi:predicted Zn-dependent peptidase